MQLCVCSVLQLLGAGIAALEPDAVRRLRVFKFVLSQCLGLGARLVLHASYRRRRVFEHFEACSNECAGVRRIALIKSYFSVRLWWSRPVSPRALGRI